jgi:hypothetical protein
MTTVEVKRVAAATAAVCLKDQKEAAMAKAVANAAAAVAVAKVVVCEKGQEAVVMAKGAAATDLVVVATEVAAAAKPHPRTKSSWKK